MLASLVSFLFRALSCVLMFPIIPARVLHLVPHQSPVRRNWPEYLQALPDLWKCYVMKSKPCLLILCTVVNSKISFFAITAAIYNNAPSQEISVPGGTHEI